MILDIPTIENLCINICFGLLLGSTVYYWSNLFFAGKDHSSLIGLLCTGSAVICLTIHLVLRWVDSSHFPLSNLYESLLFLSWSLLILHIYLETSFKTRFLGVLFSPALLCLIAFTDFSLPPELQKSSPLVPALQSNWLVMHVTVMIASYAALLFGCLIAISYLLFCWFFQNSFNTASWERFWIKQNLVFQKLENHEPSGTLTTNPSFLPEKDAFNPSLNFSQKEKLTGRQDQTKENESQTHKEGASDLLIENAPNFSPSPSKLLFNTKLSSNDKTLPLLTFLDNLSYRTIGIGFCFLTLGILSGAVWANETWGNYWSWDPKETWALITWLTFATYLHSRLIGGWTGSRPAWIASFGFFIVWICYLGVNLLGQGLHSYGFLQV